MKIKILFIFIMLLSFFIISCERASKKNNNTNTVAVENKNIENEEVAMYLEKMDAVLLLVIETMDKMTDKINNNEEEIKILKQKINELEKK